MTTNQTIDGVPRELLELIADPYRREPRSIHLHNADIDELRALLDAPAKLDLVECDACPTSGGCVSVCMKAPKPAAQQLGEPVAFLGSGVPFLRLEDATEYASYKDKRVTPLYADQPAPVAVVPAGYCIMPRRLTAENGAKALLIGEFKLVATQECPECRELEEPMEGCEICDGEGEYGQQHTISWDQIKYIYSKAVSGLAVKTESAKSR